MPKKADKKPEYHVFNTVDIVALYLRKDFYIGQENKLSEIVSFLMGKEMKFNPKDDNLHNKVRQILVKQFEWLGSLRYNPDEYPTWIGNIIRNHKLTLKVQKPE